MPDTCKPRSAALMNAASHTPRLPELGPQVPRMGNPLSRGLGRLFFALMGWRMIGNLPDLPKFIVIAAPHTSNWDAVMGFSGMLGLQLKAHTMVKADAFVGPLGWLLRALGAIPVDRASPRDIVEQTADEFAAREQMVLLMAPEGTRKSAREFKRGFHRVARLAKVPVVLAAIDHAQRAAVVSQAFQVSEDFAADRLRILEFFQREGAPRHLQNLSLPLREPVALNGLTPIPRAHSLPAPAGQEPA